MFRSTAGSGGGYFYGSITGETFYIFSIGAAIVALGAKLGITGILPGAFYGGATGAVSDGITSGVGSVLNGGNFWDGVGSLEKHMNTRHYLLTRDS